MDNIKKPFSTEVAAILDKNDLGWNSKTGRMGILFGDAMVQSFFLKKS